MNNYLLPNRFKKIGICMLVPFLVLFILYLTEVLDIDMEVPVFAIAGSGIGKSTHHFFAVIKNSIYDELVMLGLLTSLCFVALSKERDEDEMTELIRMKSFVKSLWLTAIILAFGLIFIYEFSFIYFASVALFAVFFFYIVIFNIDMWKVRRENR